MPVLYYKELSLSVDGDQRSVRVLIQCMKFDVSRIDTKFLLGWKIPSHHEKPATWVPEVFSLVQEEGMRYFLFSMNEALEKAILLALNLTSHPSY